MADAGHETMPPAREPPTGRACRRFRPYRMRVGPRVRIPFAPAASLRTLGPLSEDAAARKLGFERRAEVTQVPCSFDEVLAWFSPNKRAVSAVPIPSAPKQVF
jgi:hypothetical protein